MAVDTPARIAILGAGPIGLEAGLYARFLGYDVALFQREPICHALSQRGAEPVGPSLAACCTTLGIAALEAQETLDARLVPGASLTWSELVDAYFRPLSEVDLLADSIHVGQHVVGIDTADEPETEQDDEPEEDEEEDAEAGPGYQLTIETADGRKSVSADVVLDTAESSEMTADWADTPTWLPDATAVGRFLRLAPHYYRLGHGAAESPESFELAVGHSQIRAVFALVGDRANLDLYAGFKNLASDE